jgi:LacI family repressor for deo operon, udp, cdd, tsx, nupC, and nupG
MQLHTTVTISDVARAAGVSNSAVSYALNGKKGVSPATRERVLSVAQRLGWKPNHAAKSLSNSRASCIGLVISGNQNSMAIEPYYMHLISGLSQELETENYSLMVRLAPHITDELHVIADWIASGTVDGIVVINIQIADPRIDYFRHHSTIPVVVLADPSMTGGLLTLRSDEAQAVQLITDALAQHGHTSIGRVAGPENLGHSFIRDQAFSTETEKRGIQYACMHSNYTPEQGSEMTRRLLSLHRDITAIVYDNDVMALAGLSTASEMGVRVPQQLSIICWDDSFLCTATRPTLTAVSRDVITSGKIAAHMLLQRIKGEQVHNRMEDPYHLIVRQSLADAPNTVQHSA